jgi:predicted kinase
MNESLIVIRGPIAAGKSSVSQALHARMADSASLVETDAIKRMIDPTRSSEWRRNVAHASAAFIIERLLEVPRTGIIEAHTKHPQQLDRLAAIAERHGAPLVRVLLTAPLEVCQARAAGRPTPGLSYSIDREMVADYYCNTDPQPGDLVFDTTAQSPEEISADIFEHLSLSS